MHIPKDTLDLLSVSVSVHRLCQFCRVTLHAFGPPVLTMLLDQSITFKQIKMHSP